MMKAGSEKLTLLDLHEDFYKSEDESLMTYKIGKNSVWPYIRYTVGEELLINDIKLNSTSYITPHNEKYYSKVLNIRAGVRELLRNFYYLIIEIISIFRVSKNKKIIIIVGDDKFYIHNNKKYNLYMGTYVEMFKHRKDVLIVDQRPFIDKEIEYKNIDVDIISLGLIYRLIRIISKFAYFKPKTIALFKKNILDKFETSISPLGILKYGFFAKLRIEKLWKFIIKRFGAKVVLFANNGNMVPITHAANKQNAISVEIQHSLISRLNVLYNSGDKIAPLLSEYNPNYIVSFGESWFKTTNTTSELMQGCFNQFNVNYKKYYHKIKKHGLCVISSISKREDLFSCAINFAICNPSINTYYKLRPEEYQSYQDIACYKKIIPKNLKIILNQGIYQIFNQCEYVIGVNSTMLYEAACFQCKILVLKVGMYPEMELMISENHSKLIENDKDIDLASMGEFNIVDKNRYFNSCEVNDNLSKSILRFLY